MAKHVTILFRVINKCRQLSTDDFKKKFKANSEILSSEKVPRVTGKIAKVMQRVGCYPKMSLVLPLLY
jgi:hypothetical protein